MLLSCEGAHRGLDVRGDYMRQIADCPSQYKFQAAALQHK